MYEYWMQNAGYWLPRVDECYNKHFMYWEMSYQLKRALQCFMAEECV